MSPFNCLGRTEVPIQVGGFQCEYFVTKYFFFGEVVSTSPNHQAGGPLFSAVCDSLFNIFAATLHNGSRFSIRNLKTWQAWRQVPTYQCKQLVNEEDIFL